MTSFDVISLLRRIYHQKKIGHGGTLDPMAAGVLPVFMGKATRLIEYAPIHKKAYVAEFIMGFATDTEDVMGSIVEEGRPIADEKVWREACARFEGDIQQVPSAFSAIKVKGKRAYDLARNGEQVELPARPVHIYSIELLEVCPPYVRMKVICSSGTYIRALGRDIGKAAGCPLSMSFLLRTEMGPFTVGDARTLEEIEADPEGALMADIRPLFVGMKDVTLDENMSDGFLTGKRLRVHRKDVPVAAVYGKNRFLGIGEIKHGILHPRKVFGDL